MNIEENKLQIETVLKSQFKVKYLKTVDNIKTYKQLNYLLKTDDAVKADFIVEYNKSDEYRLVRKINTGIPLTTDENTLINSFKDKIEKMVNSAPQYDYELKEDEPLNKIISHYEQILKDFDNTEKQEEWYKPWKDDVIYAFPQNVDGRHYEGINQVILLTEQQEQGFKLPVFLTRKQVESIDLNPDDYKVSADIIFYTNGYIDENDKFISSKKIDELKERYPTQQAFDNYCADNGIKEKKVIKTHPVYNVGIFGPEMLNVIASKYEKVFSQFDLTDKPEDERKRFYDDRIDELLSTLTNYVEKEKITLSDHKSQCYYDRTYDEIAMVNRDQFFNDFDYVSTFAHESIHSTMHKDRMNRDVKKGSHHYGYEEITAETGASNLMLKYNLPSAIDKQSVSYIVGWFKELKGSKQKKYNYFLSAAKKGNEAANYINQYADLELHNEIKAEMQRQLEQNRLKQFDISVEGTSNTQSLKM